jgi:hypothetical protein
MEMKEGDKIMLVGTINDFCLETSYATAAKNLGYHVCRFDPRAETKKYVKLGTVGEKMHDFLPVEAWVKKMNRELIILAKKEEPQVIFVFGTARILYGTLITIRLLLPTVKLVWVWPDTPMNLEAHNIDNAPLYDLSAVYSKAATETFAAFGFRHCAWIPLAGDNFMHGRAVRDTGEFDSDISFVGMWRPERERTMKAIYQHFKNFKIDLHGNNWQRNCSDKELLGIWKSNGFYGKSLADHFNRSRININIIDDTNYPAANMRFFEIPISGGLQVASSCPEFENEFLDNESIVSYRNEPELVDKLTAILADPEHAQRIRQNSKDLVTRDHTYVARLKKILDLVN